MVLFFLLFSFFFGQQQTHIDGVAAVSRKRDALAKKMTPADISTTECIIIIKTKQNELKKKHSLNFYKYSILYLALIFISSSLDIIVFS